MIGSCRVSCCISGNRDGVFSVMYLLVELCLMLLLLLWAWVNNTGFSLLVETLCLSPANASIIKYFSSFLMTLCTELPMVFEFYQLIL